MMARAARTPRVAVLPLHSVGEESESAASRWRVSPEFLESNWFRFASGKLARFARWVNGVFSSPFFSARRFSPSPSRRRRIPPARPLVVPPEGYSHGGGLAAPLFREGRWTEDAQQSSKKKTMKTTSQKNNSRTPGQIRTVEQQTVAAPQAQPDKKDNRLPIDTDARKKNRTLPTEKVLNLLLNGSPELYRLAEVVGKWVWVQFKEQPAAEIRQQLAQLGFHWNRERQAWQHPCGQFRLASVQDPHEKYSSYYPADIRAN